MDTWNKPLSFQANIIPTISAASPANWELVSYNIEMTEHIYW